MSAAFFSFELMTAPSQAETLTEDTLRALVTNNTITGRYMFGGWFSEYHSGDGRVLGNNGWQENSDACWTTKSNAICYSYGPVDERQTYCFLIDRQGDSLMLRNEANGTLNAIAKLEPSNMRNHSDGGKSWNCEAQTSSLPSLRGHPTTGHDLVSAQYRP